MFDIPMLNEFVVEAKAATYVGGGVARVPCLSRAPTISVTNAATGVISTAISAAPISPDRRWCGLPTSPSGR